MPGPPPEDLLPVGRIAGHRGARGEVTVRVFDGEAEPWSGVSRVWIAGPKSAPELREVRSSRAYRDRLVLSLAGVDDASAAAGLRGYRVSVAPPDAPALAPGRYRRASLIGMEVCDRDGSIGRVADVMRTGGPDLLVVRAEGPAAGPAREILVPWVDEIVKSVDESARRIVISPPEGLLDLDRGDEA